MVPVESSAPWDYTTCCWRHTDSSRTHPDSKHEVHNDPILTHCLLSCARHCTWLWKPHTSNPSCLDISCRWSRDPAPRSGIGGLLPPCRPSPRGLLCTPIISPDFHQSTQISQTGIITAYSRRLERRVQPADIAYAPGLEVRRRSGRSRRPGAHVLQTGRGAIQG